MVVTPPQCESETRSRSDDDTWESSTAFDGTTSSYENASEESSQIAVDEKIPMSPGQAAAVIQGMYRRMKAREYFVERVRQAYEKVYDEDNNGYFYYNKLNSTSQWVTPKTLLGRSLDPQEEPAAAKLQRFVRGSCARKKLTGILNDRYEKEYDPDTDSWFYVNKVTRATTWEKPALFGSSEPPTNTSDAALLNKEREIKELRQELARRTGEAEEAKKALDDKITEERVRSKELDPDEAKGRSRHMDEWDIDAVVAWFHAVGYTQYDKSIREHQVDGLLLLHLMNEDWGHLGIASPLIVRRIDVAMQEYRVRFERKQANGGGESDDASDASSVSDTPSELLDEDDPYDDEDSDYEEEEDQNDSAGQYALDQEELDELQRDKENITKEVIFEGDEERGRPMVGDIARIHYTCALQGGNGSSDGSGGGGGGSARKGSGGTDGTVIESSRKNRRRPLEFVVGGGQVVKGIDRAIRTMLFGERARVSVTALYGYGYEGHPPIIPPDAALTFDVNLLDFRPRPRWRKPLVQVLSEPYTEVPYAPPRPLAAAAGDTGPNSGGSGGGGGRGGSSGGGGGGGGGGWDQKTPAGNSARK